MHVVSEPAILYFGTPVVLISTLNEDGSANLAPMSSAFWLGQQCVLGLGASSKTTENLLRTGRCVLNLPSVKEVAGVNRLALTTGSNPVPERKQQRGYRFEPHKFETAGFTPLPADKVPAPRVAECPVHLEATVSAVHPLGATQSIRIFHLDIIQVHLHPSILMDGHPNRVDPDKWRPLLMSFQQLYGLGERLGESVLAQIPEQLYAVSNR
ncbi:flavin reductase family protein [Chitinophaga eiseniae]|uniref:Flavin reductase family protein n=1 Tax=Chitinophaga eiseniae TaxID=634771 RepID=A0A847SN11_9BACT|nr:flavin reductase family protein [Chitinophaga eiseniae]NLR80635.1 flavin reductase family protein [Chitinophaga eiseniae]